MVKKLILIITVLMISGCATINQPPPNNPEYPDVNCRGTATIWWGEKGSNPSDNDLWKCYDWVLRAR